MKRYTLLFIVIITISCGNIHNSVPKVNSNSDDYVQLHDAITSTPRYVNGNYLKVIYQENYNDQDSKLKYNIYDQKQVIVQTNITHSINIVYGVNKISIPVSNFSSGIYVLEIINEKGVKKYLSFLKSV